MRKKNWLAWLLIAAMVANHTSVAFAAADNSGSAGIKVSLQKATVSDADTEGLASASDAEEEDPFADRDLIDDVTENESVTEDPDDEELATVSDADMVLGEDLKEEMILTDSYEVPWVNLVDIPEQFAAATYALDNAEETAYFPEEGQGSELAGYFGSQLTRQKAFDMYDTMWNYYDQVLHGDYEPTQTGVIPCGTEEEGMIWTGEGTKDELSLALSALKEEMGSYMQQAFYAFLYDYPEMFWEFTPTIKLQMAMGSSDGITWTGTVTMKVEFEASESKTEVQSMAAQLENAVDEITSQCNPQDMSTYEMLKTAHDAIAAGASYDKTLKRTYAHSPYGVLVEGLGVCESYAKALKWVCDDLGILNVLIVGIGNTSEGSGNHMWNYVQMNDDCWYAIDLTWDDQDSGIRDEYFLVGAESLGFDGERFIDSHEERYISIMNGAADDTEYFMYPELEIQAYDQSGTDNIVDIPDANLKQALLDYAVDTDGDGELSISEMEAITSLDEGILENKGIVSLTGLEYAVNLTVVTLNGNEGLDIKPLSLLPNLEVVRLNRTGICDFSALKELPKLIRLNAVGNGITSADLEVLREFPALRKVNLRNNNIEDITAIAELNLNEIDLTGNPVAVIPDGVQWAAEVFFSEDEQGGLVPNSIFSGASLTADDLDQSKFVNASVYTQEQWNTWLEANTVFFAPVTNPEWSAEYPGWAHFSAAGGAVNSVVRVYEDGTFVGEADGDKTWADLRELIQSGKSYTYQAASRLVAEAVFDEGSMHLMSAESASFEAPADMAQLPAVTNLAFEGDGLMSWDGIGDKPYANDYGKLYVVYVYDGNAADGDPYIGSLKTDDVSGVTTNLQSPSGTLKFRVRVLGDFTTCINSELSDFSPVWPEQSSDGDGWQQGEDGNWYYYQNGEMLTSQLLELEDGTYYLQENGARLTGWLQWEDGRWSWFSSEGKMRKNASFKLKEINKKKYAFDADGYMLTGWVSSADNASVTDPEGWKTADYYFDETAGTLISGWHQAGVYGGWKNETGTADYWFLFKRDETAANYGVKKIGWIEETKTDGTTTKYYLDETGAMREGLTEVDGVLYYFDPADGHMLANTEVTVDGVKYVIDENGAVTEAPQIVKQPENAEGMIGDIVSHTVEAVNAVGYTWYYSSDQGATWKLLKTWEGYNTDTLSYELTDTRLKYLFHCVVTGKNGTYTTTDDVCAVEVIRDVAITVQPGNAEGAIGEIVSHTVEAENAAGYTWYYSSDQGATWKLLKTWEGYNTDTLSYELTDTRLKYLFHCVVTGKNGSSAVTEAVCAVEAVRNVAITVQPENAEGAIGEIVSHTVEAENAVGYTWYYSSDQGATWKLLKTWEGYNTATLSYELTDTRLKYQFHCVVTGKNGSSAVTDAVHAVKVVRDAVITVQPENAIGVIGDIVSHTVEAENAVGYTWYYSSDQGATWKLLKTWEGYNTATLSYELTDTRLKYQFHCVVTGSNGSSITTNAVYAEKVSGPVITKQPSNASGVIGDTITYTVNAVGAVSYTWYYSSDQGATWKLLKTWPGYNTNTLEYELTSNRVGYWFHCVVKGTDGTTLTSDAVYVEN